MSKKFYTTYEQAYNLFKLGLPASTSDMTYRVTGENAFKNFEELSKDENNISVYLGNEIHGMLSDYYVPCWSVGALRDVIPFDFKKDMWPYSLFDMHTEKGWEYFYFVKGRSCEIPSFECENEIDSLYNLLVWMLENKFVEIKGNHEN